MSPKLIIVVSGLEDTFKSPEIIEMRSLRFPISKSNSFLTKMGHHNSPELSQPIISLNAPQKKPKNGRRKPNVCSMICQQARPVFEGGGRRGGGRCVEGVGGPLGHIAS